MSGYHIQSYMSILPEKLRTWSCLPSGIVPPLLNVNGLHQKSEFIRELQYKTLEESWLIKKEILKKEVGDTFYINEELYKKLYQYEFYDEIKIREHYLYAWYCKKNMNQLKDNLTETNLAYSNILNQMREWKEKYTTLRQITDRKMGCEEDVHFITFKQQAQMLSTTDARNKIIELQKEIHALKKTRLSML